MQILGTIEAAVLGALPRAVWLPTQAVEADVLIDVNVYSAKTTDTRSSQELRNCQQWSSPDKDAKSVIQRLMSRSCLNWQTQQTPCLTRKYEVDVHVRARRRLDDRLIASERRVFEATDKQCGDNSPATSALQAKAEVDVANWAVGLLKPPLSQLPSVNLAAPSRQDETRPVTPASPVVPHTGIPPAWATYKVGTEVHALVIGNANYSGSSRLANPVNDAVAISRKLTDLGFRVTSILDGSRETLVRDLAEFQKIAASSEVTLLYYSGHGMQIDGANYLLPVDIDISKFDTVRLQALPVDVVIESYLPGKTRIVFLDACRDNPSARSVLRSLSIGLAPIKAPNGTLIAYATRDGGLAEDGKGRHSPYTQALLDLISEPEDISLILRRVRDKVMQETAGRQQPWEYGSLSGGMLVLSKLAGK